MRSVTIPDRATMRAALEAANGIETRAAKHLGVPRTTLQKWLASERLRGLKRHAAKLRARFAPRAQGRPWTVDGKRTRGAVARAWKSSGYKLTAAARKLGLPRTSLRHLLHRYGLPNLPAPGRVK